MIDSSSLVDPLCKPIFHVLRMVMDERLKAEENGKDIVKRGYASSLSTQVLNLDHRKGRELLRLCYSTLLNVDCFPSPTVVGAVRLPVYMYEKSKLKVKQRVNSTLPCLA